MNATGGTPGVPDSDTNPETIPVLEVNLTEKRPPAAAKLDAAGSNRFSAAVNLASSTPPLVTNAWSRVDTNGTKSAPKAAGVYRAPVTSYLVPEVAPVTTTASPATVAVSSFQVENRRLLALNRTIRSVMEAGLKPAGSAYIVDEAVKRWPVSGSIPDTATFPELRFTLTDEYPLKLPSVGFWNVLVYTLDKVKFFTPNRAKGTGVVVTEAEPEGTSCTAATGLDASPVTVRRRPLVLLPLPGTSSGTNATWVSLLIASRAENR